MAPELPPIAPRSVAELTKEMMKRSHDMFASTSSEQRGAFIDDDRRVRSHASC